MAATCTTATQTFYKDTNAKLDYIFDWSDWLGEDNDTIATHFVFPSSPALIVDTTEATDTTVTAWISGGAPYTTYTVTCRIHTMGGRDEDRSLQLICMNR
jgi:RNA-binding protein YlmH